MNPIQQAEQALETAVALLHGHGKTVDPSIESALTSLRSLQKEVEGVLPDPKYIYHNSEMPGEDELFEFVDSGAVDEDCPNCERLYTADQLRTAVAAALGRGAVPQITPAQAMDALKEAFVADPSYAWTWHCGVWAAAHDEGMETSAANRAAARLMSMAFDVDTSKHENFAATQAAAPSPEGTHPTQAEAASVTTSQTVDELIAYAAQEREKDAEWQQWVERGGYDGDQQAEAPCEGEALPTLPFAVFDECGAPCEDRVRDHFRAALATQQAVQGEPVAWVTDADVACFGKGEKGEIIALLQKKAKWKHPLYAAPGQVERDREDAERWRVLVAACRETPLHPGPFAAEIAPDLRLKIDFPTIVSYDAIGNVTTLEQWADAIRATRSSKGGSND